MYQQHSQQHICGTSLLWRCLPRRAPFAVMAVCSPVAYTAAHRFTHEPGTGRQQCERLTDRLVEPIEVHANSQLPSAFIGSLEPWPPPQSPVTIRVPKMRPKSITMSPGATCCSSASHLQRKHWCKSHTSSQTYGAECELSAAYTSQTKHQMGVRTAVQAVRRRDHLITQSSLPRFTLGLHRKAQIEKILGFVLQLRV